MKNEKEIQAIVDVAVDLSRKIRQLQEELEIQKDRLRHYAVAVSSITGENTIKLQGRSGVAKVTFVKDAIKAAKDHNLLDLRGQIKSLEFESLFKVEVKETCSPKPEYLSRAKVVSKPTQILLSQYVVIEPQTPRVTIE